MSNCANLVLKTSDIENFSNNKTLQWQVNMEYLLGDIYKKYHRFQIAFNYVLGLSTIASVKESYNIRLSGLPFTSAYNLGGKNQSVISIGSLITDNIILTKSYNTLQYFNFLPQSFVNILIDFNNIENNNNDNSFIDNLIFSFNIIGHEDYKK
jgi:hypothetical protein